MGRLRVLVSYEARRLLRKKSMYLLVLLAVLPVPAALVIRAVLGEVIGAAVEAAERMGVDYSRMWAVVLGVDNPPPQMGGVSFLFSIVGAVSLSGLTWLVAVLLGGDLLAADIRDKLAHLVLVRPVSRGEYVAAKLAAALLELVVLYAAAGVAAFASMQIVLGGQAGLHEAVAFSVLVGFAALPLLLASSLMGAAVGSPTLGMVLGVVLYFASGIASSIAALVMAGAPRGPEGLAEMLRLTVELQAYNPFTAGEQLAKSLYAIAHHDAQLSIPVAGAPVPQVALDANSILWAAAPTLALATAALALANYYLLKRKDL